MVPGSTELMTILAPEIAKVLKKAIEETVVVFTKSPESKVKEGVFKGCIIGLDEDTDKAFIAVNLDKGEVVYLTEDTIQRCAFQKEDKKLYKGKFKKYYYYYIEFKDGRRCRVRMRKNIRMRCSNTFQI